MVFQHFWPGSVGDYSLVCMTKIGICVIQEVCEEGDIKVSFMHPKGPGRPENSFYWPSTKDACYVPQNDTYQLQNLLQNVQESSKYHQ